MTVTLESRGGTNEAALAETLKQGLGVEVDIVLVGDGGTAKATEIDTRQKPLRLIDERGV
jgi:phenylacetate-CoA ligase